MITLLIVLIVLMLVFGGLGYSRRATWGGAGYYGPGVLGLLVLVLLILLLTGVLH